MRLLGGVERVLRAVGELHGDARHHAHQPHAGGIADAERHQPELLVDRHGGARRRGSRARCGSRRPDKRGGDFAWHLERHHRGEVVDRRDQQPFAELPGRRAPAARSPGSRCRSAASSSRAFRPSCPASSGRRWSSSFRSRRTPAAGSATSRMKTFFCSSSKPGNVVAALSPAGGTRPIREAIGKTASAAAAGTDQRGPQGAGRDARKD